MSPGRTIGGVLVPYGVFQEIESPAEGGRFLERWAFGALRQSISQRFREKVRGYYEHTRSRIFGSAPVFDVLRVWEQQDGAHYEGQLLEGLPGFFIDGIRKGLYGTSVGARPTEVDRVRQPGHKERDHVLARDAPGCGVA